MDTIGLKFKIEDYPDKSFIEEITPKLNIIFNEGVPLMNFGIPTIKGKLRNFDISITNEQITLKNASLQKFADNSNLSPFGLKGIRNAFEEMSDLLELDTTKAVVYKMHFGKPILLKYPIKNYLQYLGNMSQFERLEFPNAIHYKTDNRSYQAYDKIKEMKFHRDHIPDFYIDKHVMRLEMQYNKNIADYFKMPSIRVADILDQSFYVNLCNEWYNAYNKIDKIKTFKIDMSNIKSVKDLHNLGVLKIIEDFGGKLNFLNEIKEMQSTKQITKKQALDLREKIKTCTTQNLNTIESELVIELNTAIKEANSFYR